MPTRLAVTVVLALATISSFPQVRAQESEDGPAESIGRRIDRGLEDLAKELRATWAEVRQSVDQLSVRGRVYGRLRWDKNLAEHPIEIAVKENDIVVLTGGVPDEESRQKAVRLAEDTVGVREVVDSLEIDPGEAPLEAGPKKARANDSPSP